MTVTTRSTPGSGVPAGAPADEVVLLGDDARPLGSADRLTVHDTATPLHLAFSLLLLDDDGRTLLTRRALAKRTWPGVWTGACCGHPRPGEAVVDAVRRRTGEELGVDLGEVATVLPDFRYRAVDASGVVENEVCPVHVARLAEGARLAPDPSEVAEHTWVGWADLHGSVTRTPFAFSPWLVLQVTALGADLPGHAR
jgi:isopentenyl-diphosphate delta-isomerase